MTSRFLAIVNPAAGGGKCGRLAPAALDRVRSAGVDLDVANTTRAGQATEFARAAYAQGIRHFLAVGGDGTAYEIVNGLFPEALSGGRPSLGFLPLGTGNSFLKDFTTRGVEHTIEALKKGTRRPCDVIRLRHSGGELYYLNLVSLGFPADVGELVNRRFKRWGELGYIVGVFIRLAGLHHAAFPHRLNDSAEWDRRPALFLSFSNSKFTGGKMMIAPKADPTDAQIEYVRWGPISRFGLVKMLPRLFSGTHIDDPRASRAPVQRIDLELTGPTNVMIDGEILRLQCKSLEILPAALDAIV
ncbi:MAG: diacylglycerol/lipid kinase family protein [Candidatus Acidiferrales bacterium]